MRRATRVWVVLLAAAILIGVVTPMQGGPVSDKRTAQNKLLAARAARADGIRKLAERIKGLFITSETTVRDFVATSDTIETGMVAFLTGVREKGKPKHMEDGTCQVVMEVTIQEVIVALKQMHKKYYKGDKFKIVQFDQMTVTNKLKVLRETGNGAPRPSLEEDLVVKVTEGNVESFDNLRGAAKAFWLARVTGQGRLMAIQAARRDAQRRLGERIAGVLITSETTVRDFVVDKDEINTLMKAFLVGSRATGVSYHADELIVEVTMEVTLRDVLIRLQTWAKKHYKGDKVKITQLEKLTVRTKDKIIKEVGSGVPGERFLKKTVTVAEKRVIALGRAVPGWGTRTISAVGNAALDTEGVSKAQAKLMAFRGAELDARRKLAERIDGLMITSNTSVANFVAHSDQIATDMLAFQQGARVLERSKKLLEDGVAQVTVEIDLKPLWGSILYWQRTLSLTIK